MRSLGTAQAPAANEPGHLVEAALYAARVVGPVRAMAEIAELLWLDPGAPDGSRWRPSRATTSCRG